MRPRGGSEQSAKSRHANKPKARKTTSAAAPSIADLQKRMDVLTRELKETRDQRSATTEVLRIINSQPASLAPVFDAILQKAHALCGADDGSLQIYDGEHVRAVAVHGVTERFAKLLREGLSAFKSPAARASFEGQRYIQINDARETSHTILRAAAELTGTRTILYMPLRMEDRLLGFIAAARREVKPFTENEIGLLENFAAQAVVAMENARLFNETQEALERQTATADVLKVISRSAFDLDSVLSTLVTSAARLCAAERGMIFLREGDLYRMASNFGFSPELEAFARANPLPADGASTTARAGAAGAPVQAVDLVADKTQGEMARAYQRLGGHKTNLGVPLRRDGKTIGVFTLTRQVVQAFTPRQIELVQTFADQAVIAIENVRLFDDVQAKTRDIEEALRYQTGSANILNVIAASPTDVGPALQAIVDSACEICDASDAVVFLKDGDDLAFSAHHGSMPNPIGRWPINRNWVTGRAVMDKVPQQAHDLLGQSGDEFPEARNIVPGQVHRTVLSIPLLQEGDAIGAISLRRMEAQPFSEKQIELLRSFADQAVISISNVRLFEKVQERTRELSKSLDDLRTAQDRLIQTEKLASLGHLTAGIAHEIKNPLNFVNNFAALSVELTDELKGALKPAVLEQTIRAEVDEITGLLKDNLDRVVQHGKRADSIVKNMLLHSREGSGERRSADINALVGESLNLAYHGARAEKSNFTITLKHDLDPNAGALNLYPQEITRALLNLIANGFYAATRRKVEAGDETFEPVLTAATRNHGKTVEIRIRDNGSGIPPAVREKMFIPFFTTKPTGEGTGLGLSMTHDIIVKQHGGTIDVETELGEFTEFIITLPRDDGTTIGDKSR